MLSADIARAAAAAADEVGEAWYVLPAFGDMREPPGTYSTPVALRLAGPAGRAAPQIAAALAQRLRELSWIAATAVTGHGHLRVTVTDGALTGLCARIAAAGHRCGLSDALADRELAPVAGDFCAAATWARAHADTTAEVTARCAAAAGARVTPDFSERLPRRCHAMQTASTPRAGATDSPADLVAFAGRDAVRYALCRAGSAVAMPGAARAAVKYHLSNPGYAVRYAHAHAAATLRQAAAFGTGGAQAFACAAHLLGHPVQRALLHVLSWLPERVAAVARRAEPRVLAGYLERVAGAYYAAHEACPALPYAGGPDEPAAARARLGLAAAAKTVLATGLGLLGVSAPDVL